MPSATPSSTALVLGVGGLGHMAVQILEATTAARVLAVDVRDAALELAREAGADAVLSADGLTPAGIRSEFGPDGATVALDLVGADATLEPRSGAIHSEAEVYSLDGAVAAYGRLQHGEVVGRASSGLAGKRPDVYIELISVR